MPRFLLLFLICLSLFPSLSAQQLRSEWLEGLKIRTIGPAAMSGRVTSITCDPKNGDIIYAGTASGGVWRSTSGGTNWEPIFEEEATQSIGTVAIHPLNPDLIWVGTGEGNPRNSQNFGKGIYRSEDGGETWKLMGLENTKTIHRIILHRDNPDVIWVAAMGSSNGPNADRGVFKSTDGGKTWRKVLYINDLTGCADLVVDPKNPNKLIAAMWEYRRYPWIFHSGGKGSGLHISHDGGETWTQRTDKDGLPDGELGRIGVAIAASNTDVVYALVEAKENALYKSMDGGKKWKKMAEKRQGDRPFYYSELYVDPKYENRVYSIHTWITKSEDGGKTFEEWAGWDIHPDHHAFWIHPDDPKYIIDGNDGGINLTHDGGKSWHYAENIPLGQFYHVSVDNDIPYNVYGGLQDNGSWAGPSEVWREGQIRNSDWQEVLFGDGFDVVARTDSSRFIYAMSQGGNVYYIDRLTGKKTFIRPISKDSVPFRFNWNTAIAQDPFSPRGVYLGSQVVHYSPDCGASWATISPDLTTNDTSKMHQDISGGLTLDATNAENHCTVIAIAPSSQERGTIWASTDDGNLQITRDGGKSWQNLSPSMPKLPKNPWMPYIELSKKNKGEAFVVVNNYRQNDFEPYLYHTKDYGRTWKQLVSKAQIGSFVLSVVQDPEAENLLFLGADDGLYVSTDYGSHWTKWHKKNFPPVPVQDMKIQEREADLVIGTFGRALWILDDIRPLRAIAQAQSTALRDTFRLFPVRDTYQPTYNSYQGVRFSADAQFYGENRDGGVRVRAWVDPKYIADAKMAEKDKSAKEPEKAEKKSNNKDEKKDKGGKGASEKATIFVMDMQGDTIRRFKARLDSCFNTIVWRMDTKGVRMPSNDEPSKEELEPGGGPAALPGTYKMVASWNGFSDSVMVKVFDDPRGLYTYEQRRANAAVQREFNATIEKATRDYERLKTAESIIGQVETQLANVPDSTKKAVIDMGKTLRDTISVLREQFFQQKPPKGIQRNPNALTAHIWTAKGYLGSSTGAPSPNAETAVFKAVSEIEKMNNRIKTLMDGDWKKYREAVEAIKYSVFKDF